MRRVICFLLIFSFSASLIGCSFKKENVGTDTAIQEKVETIEPISTTIETETAVETDTYYPEPETFELSEETYAEMVNEPDRIPEEYEWIITLCRKTDEIVYPYENSERSTTDPGYLVVFDGLFEQYPDVDMEYLYRCIKFEIWYTEEKNSFTYFLKDLDGNGIPELFITNKNGIILMIFTISGGTPILLDNYWNRYGCKLLESNELLTYGSGGAAYSEKCLLYLPYGGTRFEKSTGYGRNGEDSYYVIENGIQRNTSREEFLEFVKGFDKLYTFEP